MKFQLSPAAILSTIGNALSLVRELLPDGDKRAELENHLASLLVMNNSTWTPQAFVSLFAGLSLILYVDLLLVAPALGWHVPFAEWPFFILLYVGSRLLGINVPDLLAAYKEYKKQRREELKRN